MHSKELPRVSLSFIRQELFITRHHSDSSLRSGGQLISLGTATVSSHRTVPTVAMAALCRLLPASCRRAYHNDTSLVRVADRFNIRSPREWHRLNRAAVIKEFTARGTRDKEVPLSIINQLFQYYLLQVQRAFQQHIYTVLQSRSPENVWIPWLFKGGVPYGFWSDKENHVQYARWLAAELQLLGPEDWYNLNKKMVHQNGGKGLLTQHYNGSPQQFVLEVVRTHLHPDYEWLAWQFENGVPKGFWEDSANHVQYARWLAAELQLLEPEDWYQLTAKTIQQHSGGGLLVDHYYNSPQQFVEHIVYKHLHPDYEWFPWKFERGVPPGFWEDSDNHAWYVEWLAAELQLLKPEDWDQLTSKIIQQHNGGGLLKEYYNGSPKEFVNQVVVLKEYYNLRIR